MQGSRHKPMPAAMIELQVHSRAVSCTSDDFSDGMAYLTATVNSPRCSEYESAVSGSVPDSGLIFSPDFIHNTNFTFRSSQRDESQEWNGEPTYDIFVLNLTYKVVVKKRSWRHYRVQRQEKVLLNNVTAQARHGEILAVVGPSGSSKTTFLDALAGRIDWGRMEGVMFLNGMPVDDNFHKISQYVMQDDALFPMLTTMETLMFSARMRLPDTVPYQEKLRRVESIMQQLRLTHCSHTCVGNEMVKGVSGGERRRISIGVELIHDPAVIFLDEPTSGLDSTSAFQLMQILSNLSEHRKRTIILTMHQPSYRIQSLIPQVLVLGRGSVVYHGSFADMPEYFTRLHIRDIPPQRMPDHVNVVEYAIDKVREYQDNPETFQQLISCFQKRIGNARQNEVPGKAEISGKAKSRAAGFATSFPEETLRLIERSAKIMFRTEHLLASQILIKVVGAIVLGTIFMQVQTNLSGVMKRQGYFSFTLAVFIFSSNMAIPVLLGERQIFQREASRGAYRKCSYAVAHALVLLPHLFFLSLLFSAISYFLVGLVPNATAFFVFVMLLFLAMSTANAMVAVATALSPNFIVANGVAAAIFSYFLLFSGYFLPRTSIPVYWLWVHYMSIFKYSYEALLHNEFGRLQHTIWDDKAGFTSHQILQSASADSVHLWHNVAILAAFFLAYRILFYLVICIF